MPTTFEDRLTAATERLGAEPQLLPHVADQVDAASRDVSAGFRKLHDCRLVDEDGEEILTPYSSDRRPTDEGFTYLIAGILSCARSCRHLRSPQPAWALVSHRVLVCGQCVNSLAPTLTLANAVVPSDRCDLCEEHTETFREMFTQVGPTYVHGNVCDRCFAVVNADGHPVGMPRTVGHNDPCPCGSGSKFKRCHGRAT
jgi:SEC-C motif